VAIKKIIKGGLWMRLARTSFLAAGIIALSVPALAQGLDVPAKTLPIPQGDVSPQVQKLIGMPLRNGWNVTPKTGEEWKPIADAGAEPTIKNLPGLLERMAVKVEKSTIDGVRVFLVTPATVKP
jgi:monoterpene epsilon-lactone hydrolase